MNSPERNARLSRHELPVLTPKRLWIGVLAITLSVLGLWMDHDVKHYPCKAEFHHHIPSPVLAIELASNREEVKLALEPGCGATPQEQVNHQAHEALLRNTVADLFFIPLYSLFIWSFGYCVGDDKPKLGNFFQRALMTTVISTAIADYAEDIGVLRSLCLGASNTIARWTSWPSRIKWAMLALSLLLTAVILIRSQTKMYSLGTRILLTSGYTIAGALIATGLRIPYLIRFGMTVLAVIVVLQIIALFGPYIERRIWLGHAN
jgi:hypothetical protein